MNELVLLVRQWSASTQAQVNERANQLQNMLKGRGVGAVAQTTVGTASQLVVDEIDDFLTG